MNRPAPLPRSEEARPPALKAHAMPDQAALDALENAAAEAEAEREAEQKRRQSIDEETPSRGYPISVSAGSNSAGRS